MSHEISLFISTPDAPDPAVLLNRVADALENNRLPPQVPSVKGFMRHVLRKEFTTPTQLSFKAHVEEDLMRPVMSNMDKALLAGMITVAGQSMFGMNSELTVKCAVSCIDLITNRAIFFSMTQYPGDTADFKETGSIKAPVVEYLTIPDLSLQDFKLTDLQLWEGPNLRQLIDTLTSYIEEGRARSH